MESFCAKHIVFSSLWPHRKWITLPFRHQFYWLIPVCLTTRLQSTYSVPMSYRPWAIATNITGSKVIEVKPEHLNISPCIGGTQRVVSLNICSERITNPQNSTNCTKKTSKFSQTSNCGSRNTAELIPWVFAGANISLKVRNEWEPETEYSQLP